MRGSKDPILRITANGTVLLNRTALHLLAQEGEGFVDILFYPETNTLILKPVPNDPARVGIAAIHKYKGSNGQPRICMGDPLRATGRPMPVGHFTARWNGADEALEVALPCFAG